MEETNTKTAGALATMQKTGGQLANIPDPAKLTEQLEKAKQYRELTNNHIKSTFSKWVHYYRHHFVKDCKVWHCEDIYHISRKWEITQEGAKKLLSDFLLFPDYKTDEETRSQFANNTGLVSLICYIYTQDGKFFSSGRGSCKVDGYSDENRSTKMAQKRALIDALKSSGLLADFEIIINEKEGEIPGEFTRVEKTPQASTQNKWCEFCPSKGKYHARTCPLFDDPRKIEANQSQEVIDGEVDEEINMDEIPDFKA